MTMTAAARPGSTRLTGKRRLRTRARTTRPTVITRRYCNGGVGEEVEMRGSHPASDRDADAAEHDQPAAAGEESRDDRVGDKSDETAIAEAAEKNGDDADGDGGKRDKGDDGRGSGGGTGVVAGCRQDEGDTRGQRRDRHGLRDRDDARHGAGHGGDRAWSPRWRRSPCRSPSAPARASRHPG